MRSPSAISPARLMEDTNRGNTSSSSAAKCASSWTQSAPALFSNPLVVSRQHSHLGQQLVDLLVLVGSAAGHIVIAFHGIPEGGKHDLLLARLVRRQPASEQVEEAAQPGGILLLVKLFDKAPKKLVVPRQQIDYATIAV